MIINGAESFLLPDKNSPRAVLLIHGFTGNPAELRLLGEHLHANGLTVLCMRLTGHGTSADDLVRSNRGDWFNSVLDGLAILNGLCGSISIVGHSMGGLLALKAAAMFKVDRLVAMSTPIFIDDGMHLSELPPRSECGGLAVHKPRRTLQNVPRGVNDVYQSMPLLSVHELVDTIEETKKILPKVETPILIMHGTADHTARCESAQYIFDRVSSTEKELAMFEGMGHLIPLKDGRERVFERATSFLLQT
ncbi:MAG: alpha/beta fold hydrolase [Selenomonadaceae bacterium]|nr:alpha/beta fold hydrolase [Selenomonadaceae bacterium]